MDSDDSHFEALRRAKYVSLATFRKSGDMVATPVWSAEADGAFYVFSAADAGKVKRLRNSSRAQLAVCTFNGKLQGDWIPARAVLIDEPADTARALAALRRKYGVTMWLTDLTSRLTGRYDKRAYIRIELT